INAERDVGHQLALIRKRDLVVLRIAQLRIDGVALWSENRCRIRVVVADRHNAIGAYRSEPSIGGDATTVDDVLVDRIELGCIHRLVIPAVVRLRDVLTVFGHLPHNAGPRSECIPAVGCLYLRIRRHGEPSAAATGLLWYYSIVVRPPRAKVHRKPWIR